MAESFRASFERERRKKIATERRTYQILHPWLQHAYPEIFSEFETFFNGLAERNPRTKNLAITIEFKYFLRHKKGVYYVFLSYVVVNLLLTVFSAIL